MRNRHLYLLASALTVMGLVLFLYKAWWLDFPLIPETRSFFWKIETRISFTTQGEPVRIAMFIPRHSRRFVVVDENLVSHNYGVNVTTEDGKRKAIWTIRKAAGPQTLFYNATVRRMDQEIQLLKPSESGPRPPEFTGARLEASRALIAEVRDKSADTDSLVVGLLQRINQPQPGENLSLLLGPQPSIQKKVAVIVDLLALAGIHARSVHGVRLQDQVRSAPVIHWLEVYDQGKWSAYEPATGEQNIPDDYFPWWRGVEPLVQSKGAEKMAVTFSVARGQEAAIQSAVASGKLRQPLLLDFSLFSLPIQTQAVYHVLLLVPVGALLLVILRNVVGVRTFGTFMPVLIALAFRETQLLWGVFLFTILVAAGLIIRLYLEHLKLLVVPRLAAILIVVVGLMALLSVLTHKLGLERGLSVALFPMVIMTMTIERMSIVWDELGPAEALKQGLGTLVVAVLTYLVMSIKYIEHLLFVFPELLLVLLAATLLLGRYSGFRLLEFRRFKALVESESELDS